MNNIYLLGIIGKSIQYSLSPVIHEYWMKKSQIKGKYNIYDLQEEELESFLKNAYKLGIKGLNVTIPYKNKIISLIDDLSNEAKIMGAVNSLIIKSNGTIYGNNTDTEGFLNNLEKNWPHWKQNKQPIVIIGAGGAARAVIYSLLKFNNSEIRLVNRNKSRATNLITDLLKIFPNSNINIYDNHNEAVKDSSFLINASSLGMTGHPDLKIDLKYMKDNATVYDIVYSPLETNLLKQAKKYNYKTIDGLGMLLEQAVPSFNSWFNKDVKVTIELKNKIINFLNDKK